MSNSTHITKKKGLSLLAIGALGVVFGDIGTSPLYAMQALFGSGGQHLANNQETVFGIISLIIWSITLIVSVKYVGFIMKADNKGEGGILALVGLVKSGSLKKRTTRFFIFVGLIGLSLFYGDSVITPAISVLSAVEGIKVVAPHVEGIILPITLLILVSLFWIQKYGTNTIGKLFGPVMAVWFITIGLGGFWQVTQYPAILEALSPVTAIMFCFSQPLIAFIAMSAIVLAITGAEALYADMGHFGRAPIARAWFFLVFPALTLCYMGQGALMMKGPDVTVSLFIQLFPDVVRIPVIILATLATLIASQSVISGAFSLTKQAVQLNFLPKMLVKHTSNREIGQIYLPFVNFLLAIAVMATVIIFHTSENLAGAYGIAVSGTLAADTVLFIVVLKSIKKRPIGILYAAGLAFLPIDFIFISSNVPKIFHGGILPILIGISAFILMTTWIKGERVVEAKRQLMEGNLQDFVHEVRMAEPTIKRIAGEAVYLGHHTMLTPLALRATVEELHELPERVIIVSIKTSTAAHVSDEHRITLDESLNNVSGISHVTLLYGFNDRINVPHALRRHLNPILTFDETQIVYFVSLTQVVLTKRHTLAQWRKFLYRLMARNALTASDYYKLPVNRTEEMQSLIKL